MAGISDEAFARAAQQAGVVTFDDLEAAKAVQAESAKKGVLLPLADVLVQQGVITAKIRENIEKKLQAQQSGGIKQLGQYKLLKKLGEGGMGAVYLADDTHVGRQVAVKVLAKKHAGDAEFVTRFRREARAAGSLNHVNIVSAYVCGEDQGHHYLAMEYCDGEPLDKILKRNGSLPWNRAIEVILQVARGLKHAHEHAIVHRDIKPSNIMICKPLRGAGVAPGARAGAIDPLVEGFVAKILDLGLSKSISGDQQSFYTQTGVAVGTPHYISPEQAKGEKSIDGRADIYSLGATFYHLVTGQTPFQGSTPMAIMYKQINEQLPNPRDINGDIPDGVVHVIQRMMAKEPADRYANCNELLDDLELVRDGKAPSSQPIDVGKSSVAVAHVARTRTASPPGGTGVSRSEEAAAPGSGRPDGPIPPVATREGEPSERPSGSRRAPEDGATEGTAGQARRDIPLGRQIAIGAAVLGVLILVVALSRGGKSNSGDPKPPGISKAEAAKAEPGIKTAPLEATVANPEAVLPNELSLDLGGGVKMDFVLVPAGEFMMGEEEGEAAEKPPHKVKISKPFYMAKYAVTLAQFRGFVESVNYQTDCERAGNKGFTAKDGKWQYVEGVNWKNPGFEQTPDQPVVMVTWNDAQVFVTWMRKVTGRDVHLPTEAQWEYAARGQNAARYPWGDKWSGTKANHADVTLKKAGFNMQWGESGDNDGFAYTAPVGTYENASWCGAFDMSGNVFQWCQDLFTERYYQYSPEVDPAGAAGHGRRVLRGGSFIAGPSRCRSAHRTAVDPGECHCDFGFRAALSAPSQPPTAPEEELAANRKRIENAWSGRQGRLTRKEGRFELRLDGCGEVRHLWPLLNMPISSLSLRGTPVADLTPLRGMPLVSLDLEQCGNIKDLSPICGLPLTTLNLRGCVQIQDFTPLSGMKLISLDLGETAITDLTPLKSILLSSLSLWRCAQVRDLSPLAGMKLTSLDAGFTPVSDLAPLKGLPLTSLDLWFCAEVRDISPLAEMKLEFLDVSGTHVSNLTALKGMPLTGLGLSECEDLRDLAPLEGMNLEKINLTPKTITKGLEIVRNMKTLTSVAADRKWWFALPTEEFWKKHDNPPPPVPVWPRPVEMSKTEQEARAKEQLAVDGILRRLEFMRGWERQWDWLGVSRSTCIAPPGSLLPMRAGAVRTWVVDPWEKGCCRLTRTTLVPRENPVLAMTVRSDWDCYLCVCVNGKRVWETDRSVTSAGWRTFVLDFRPFAGQEVKVDLLQTGGGAGDLCWAEFLWWYDVQISTWTGRQSDLIPLAQIASRPDPDWYKAWSLENDGTGRPNKASALLDGRESVVTTHPASPATPARFSRKCEIPRDNPRLKIEVRSLRGCALKAYFDGTLFHECPIGKLGWTDLELDLSKWAGKTGEVAVEHIWTPNAWVHAFWANIEVVGGPRPLRAEPPAAPGKARPVWDGKESVADYAKRVGLAPTETLALGRDSKLELVLIPPGQFTMGSPADEPDHAGNEAQHQVTISRPFYMAKEKISQADFELIMGYNPSKRWQVAVNMVSWDTAQEFCQKTSRKVGRTVRLPTEAEWEYACRAGTQKPDPVAGKKANVWGLSGLNSAPAEWCADWYEGVCPDQLVTDPQGPAVGARRVSRGGGWRYWAWRGMEYPGYRDQYTGFRVVVECGSSRIP